MKRWPIVRTGGATRIAAWFLHTPLYIILAEALIVVGIAPLARQVLEKADFRQAAAIGLLAGLWTVVAGMIGYGLCEFIPNGLRLP